MKKHKSNIVLNIQMFNKIIIIATILILIRSSPDQCQDNQYYSIGICVDCPLRCSSCTNGSYCTTCQQGSYKNSLQCRKCSAKNCKTCPLDKCSECMESYEIDRNTCSPKSDYKLILTSIGLALFGILFALCCSCWIIKHCRKNRRQTGNVNSIIQSYSLQQINSNSLIKIDQNWKFNQEANTKFEQICSICLDDKSNVFLNCSHVYHMQCITIWLQRNIECPLCKRPAFGVGKIFCRQCFKYYKQVHLQHLKRGCNIKSICDNCQSQKLLKIMPSPDIKLQEQFIQNDDVLNN